MPEIPTLHCPCCGHAVRERPDFALRIVGREVDLLDLDDEALDALMAMVKAARDLLAELKEAEGG